MLTTLAAAVLLAAAAGSLEEGIIQEMNLARTQPKTYAQYVAQQSRGLRGKDLVEGNVRIRTKEGKNAYDEAVRFLSGRKPLPPLQQDGALARAAAELAAYQARTGTVGHEGERGEGPEQRIDRQGKWEGSIGENVAYGPPDPRRIVIQLIVDDGVTGRGHRKNIFSSAFRKAGVACAEHATFGRVCVTDFATAISAP